LVERESSLAAQRQDLQIEFARLDEECKSAKEVAEKQGVDLKRLSEECEEVQAELTKTQLRFKQKQEEKTIIEREINLARKQVVTLETEKIKKNASIEELKNRKRIDEEALVRTKVFLDQQQIETREMEKKLASASNDKEVLEKKLESQREQIQVQRSRLEEYGNQQKQNQKDQMAIESEISRLVARQEVLKQAEQSQSGLSQGIQNIFAALKKGKISGGFTSLSGILETPAELDSAIAAALGDFLDAVVVDHAVDMDRVMDFMLESDNGRAILLPASLIRTPTEAGKWDQDGVIGIAADLVQCREDFRPILSFLLGQVIVVKDRLTAKRLLLKIPEYVKVVTLNGDVFWPGGIITTGKMGKEGIIARPRQKREMEETINDVQKRLRIVINEAEERLVLLRAEEEKFTTLEEDYRKCRKEYENVESRFREASLGVRQCQQKMQIQVEQTQQLQKRILQADQVITQNSKAVEEIETSIQQANEKVKIHSKELHRVLIAEVQADLVHWQTKFAVLSQSLKDATLRLEDYRRVANNIENRIQHNQTKRSMADAAYSEVLGKKTLLVARESEIQGEIHGLQSKADPLQEEVNLLEEQFNKKQEAVLTLQQSQTIAERYSTQTHLDVTRQREAIENLQRRIEDDFGLVAFEYRSDIPGPNPLPFEGMVAELPLIDKVSPETEENINRQRTMLRRMGAINPDAQKEYIAIEERFEFLTDQVADLKKADEDLRKVIAELDVLMKQEFQKTFNAVAIQFRQMFTRLFGGGAARLVLLDEENPADAGIEIEAQLPGRRKQGLALLSGGERSLTAAALIFALLRVSPTPFCVLDEVDAALDEANVGRFGELLRELSKETQFIVITHNRNTVQISDVIYGVTMGRESTSQVISLRLDEVSPEMAQ
jgi:chromosome segregation protein